MTPIAAHTRSSGFTLVELAIVLVIIGLLVGGILVGSSMIRTAELQAIIRQEESFRAAIYSFQNKYNGIPGDLKNATSFWESAGGNGSDTTCRSTNSTCRSTNSTGSQATCNGNGNGGIEMMQLATVEVHRFWQQLSNAGLIAGNFSGTYASTNSPWSTSTANAPGSKRNGLWFTSNQDLSASNETFAIPPSNYLMIGGYYEGWGPGRPFLTPLDAWNIDVKADDGKPAQGRIIAGFDTNEYHLCTTATNRTELDAAYLHTEDAGPRCKLFFVRAY